MTTSLNAHQPQYQQPVSARVEKPACAKDQVPFRHACEIQRMKDFAGRRRFQAPVADDFARGLLAPGQDQVVHTTSLAQVRGALASVVLGLRTLCAGPKPADNSQRNVVGRD